jgi:hypothetical protein
MTCDECGYLLSKILIQLQEARDIVYWSYGLRSELPPYSEVKGLKMIDLSYNRLGDHTLRLFESVLKTDRYFYAIDLRHNKVSNQGVKSLLEALENNKTIFNVDLRNNLGIQASVNVKLAIKLLSNYVNAYRKLSVSDWEEEQKYFRDFIMSYQAPEKLKKIYSQKVKMVTSLSAKKATIDPKVDLKDTGLLNIKVGKKRNSLEPIREESP